MNVPVIRWATVLIVVVVVFIGGLITILTGTGAITDPDSKLSFGSYLRDVAIALGLLGVGHGLDSVSRP